MDSETAAAVDESREGAYSRRHTHMDQELLAYLTQAGDLGAAASGTEEAAYGIAAAHIKALLDGPQPSTDPVDASGVATMSGRKPLHLRCVEIVRDIGGQVSRDQIVNALRDAGEKPGEQV